MPQSASHFDRWRSRAARCGSLARAELTDEGVVLGTRTILAYSLRNPYDEADRDRFVALLAAATRGRVVAATPARIAKALARASLRADKRVATRFGARVATTKNPAGSRRRDLG